MARLLFLLLLATAAQARRKGVNVKKKEKVEPEDMDDLVLEEIDIEEANKVTEVLKKNFEQVMVDVRKSLEESLLKVEKEVSG